MKFSWVLASIFTCISLKFIQSKQFRRTAWFVADSRMLKHYRLNRSSPDDDEPTGGDNSDHEKENQKIKFEIKPLPRPQAPEHLKRQASLRAFVPRYALSYNAQTRAILEKFSTQNVTSNIYQFLISIFLVWILSKLPSKTNFDSSPKQEAFKTSKSARTFAPSLADKFRGKEILNPVPEIEPESPRTSPNQQNRPVQSVAPFTRGGQR